MAYATLSDLTAWLGATPDDTANATRLLTVASRRMDSVLIGAVYDVDDDGLPTDTDVAAVLRDAVCAQVEWWDETGDTSGTGAGGEWSSVSIGKVSLGAGNGVAGTPTGRRYAPEALEILRVAGLLPVSAYMVG